MHPSADVVTVFSGGPERVDPLPWWDQMCEVFEPGDDVTAVRRGEDLGALAVAGARAHHLGFWDEQYRAGPPALGRLGRLWPGAVRRRPPGDADGELEARVKASIRHSVEEIGAPTWLIPLGLHRGDHELVARACLDLVGSRPDVRWVVYEELPYGAECPEKAGVALEHLGSAGFVLGAAELEVDPGTAKKAHMVRSHRSQMAALGHRVDMAIEGDEVYHLISSRRLAAP